MKWYHSIKIKLIGFFLFVATVFLLTIIIIFYTIKSETLTQRASQEISYITAEIFSEIKHIKGRVEERVLTLASVAKEEDKNINIINSIFTMDKDIPIRSGGIWFDPYKKGEDKDHFHFFYKTAEGKFIEDTNYQMKFSENYRERNFYQSAKNLKKGEVFWTNIYYDKKLKTSLITLVSPIYSNQNFIGVVSLDLMLANSSKRLLGTKFDEKEKYLLMIDREGSIMGKSPIFDKYLEKEDDIPNIYNPKIKNLFTHIKPSLSDHLYKDKPNHTNDHQPKLLTEPKEIYHNDIINTLFFINDDPILGVDSIVSVYHFPETDWKIIIGMPKNKVMSYINKTFGQIVLATVLVTLFAVILGYFLLKRFFVNPIESINVQIKSSLSNLTHRYKTLNCEDKGEIGSLVENLNARTIALKNSLSKAEQEMQKRIMNEKLLLQQSKMAAMGEMMDSVAHQWKQPLNALSIYSDLIKNDFSTGDVDQKYIEDFSDDIRLQIDHMVTTLDEFRSFFRPNKDNQEFEVIEIINSVIFLTKDDFLKNHIHVQIKQEDTITLKGSENEFKHIFLNLFGNAKDAFNENNIQNRNISIRIIHDEEFDTIEIEDNAGGIPEEIIDTLFDANVTTKEDGKGTGIGLYLSNRIAKKYGGILSAYNTLEGACFVLEFKKDTLHSYSTLD